MKEQHFSNYFYAIITFCQIKNCSQTADLYLLCEYRLSGLIIVVAITAITSKGRRQF